MVPDDGAVRLQRLLRWRRNEEERARRREAEALSALEDARRRLRAVQETLRTCRECAQHDVIGGAGLIDAQACMARLSEQEREQLKEVDDAVRALVEAREALAEAGRRRLAIERLSGARAVRLRDRQRAEAQANLDESGRLRLLLEGDRGC